MSSALAQHVSVSSQSIAKDVILTESKALQALAASLNNSFDQAVDLIRQTEGRLIISGMGKSGHIGRKIAATFASTGQPALFLHAAEAGHGDLGMIAKGDTILLISYSGEAHELTTILDYSRRLSLPILSITGRDSSTLARLSTLSLILPPMQEACPMGLAPTTSTTVTLALGDALAVALLSLRGFSKQQFHIFHPGGNLGKQLRRVTDFMHQGSRIPLVPKDMLMGECLVKMTAYGFGCVGVLDDQSRLVGIITDGDLRRHMHPNLLMQTAKEVMTKGPITLTPDCLMSDALAIFERKSITSVFIVDNNQEVCGILHVHDCLRNHAT